MKKSLILIVFLSLLSCKTKAQENVAKSDTNKKTKVKMTDKIKKTEAEWRAQLTEQEYHVLREAGTDRPSEGGYTSFFEKGTYVCRACGTQLFESNSKYKSHCGWPSFDDAIEGTIIYKKDTSLGRVRTEIICAKCDSHLGHVFDDGPADTTGKRYCVNTSSIKFVK